MWPKKCVLKPAPIWLVRLDREWKVRAGKRDQKTNCKFGLVKIGALNGWVALFFYEHILQILKKYQT